MRESELKQIDLRVGFGKDLGRSSFEDKLSNRKIPIEEKDLRPNQILKESRNGSSHLDRQRPLRSNGFHCHIFDL